MIRKHLSLLMVYRVHHAKKANIFPLSLKRYKYVCICILNILCAPFAINSIQISMEMAKRWSPWEWMVDELLCNVVRGKNSKKKTWKWTWIFVTRRILHSSSSKIDSYKWRLPFCHFHGYLPRIKCVPLLILHKEPYACERVSNFRIVENCRYLNFRP